MGATADISARLSGGLATYTMRQQNAPVPDTVHIKFRMQNSLNLFINIGRTAGKFPTMTSRVLSI